MSIAHDDYVKAWEQWMDNWLENPQGNRGSDILRMFKMKAEKPEKYRVEAPLKMLEKLAEIAARERAEREARGSGQVVEGEIRDIGDK
jgi:hypothetical protein